MRSRRAAHHRTPTSDRWPARAASRARGPRSGLGWAVRLAGLPRLGL